MATLCFILSLFDVYALVFSRAIRMNIRNLTGTQNRRITG